MRGVERLHPVLEEQLHQLLEGSAPERVLLLDIEIWERGDKLLDDVGHVVVGKTAAPVQIELDQQILFSLIEQL